MSGLNKTPQNSANQVNQEEENTSLSADDIINNVLMNKDALDTIAVSQREGNRLTTDPGLAKDLVEMNYGQLVSKYGVDVANHSFRLRDSISDMSAIRQADRSTGAVVGDALVSAGAGFVGLAGNTAGVALGAGLGELAGIGARHGAVATAELTQDAVEGIKSLQTQELQDRRRLQGIAGELDAMDSEAQFREDVEAGANPFMAALSAVGRDALNAGDRITDDAAIVGDIVAESIGSLGPSAKIAALSGRIAAGATARVTANETAKKLAQTMGVAAGVGASEASGTYAQTVNEVLEMDHEQLAKTSEGYRELIADGMSPEQARIEIAGITGEVAFMRQLPTAAALGLISSKFEAAPVGSFRGAGVVGGAKSIAGQGAEEALQGGSSAFNQNVAIRDNVDESRSLSQGVGEELASGAIGGLGQSGAAAVPAAGIGAAASVAEDVSVLVQSGAVQEGVSKVASATASAAGNTLDAVAKTSSVVAEKAAPYAKPVAEKAQAAAAAVSEKAQPIIHAASPVTNRIADLIDPPDSEGKQLQAHSAQRTEIVATKLMERENPPAELQAVASQPDAAPVPESLKDFASPDQSLVQNTVAVVQKLSDSKSRVRNLPDAEVLYMAGRIQSLTDQAQNLPAAMQREISSMVSGSEVQQVLKKAKTIDLNKTQDASAEVTPDVVSETVAVARTNPSNVNPQMVSKILEQSKETGLSDEDVRILGVAQKVASAVNNHVGRRVEIAQDKITSLSVKKEYQDNPKKLERLKKKETIDAEDASRSLQVDGFTDAVGNQLRSVNDFASDILQGAQSPDGSFTDAKGRSIPVSRVVEQFAKFRTHMANKVEALNNSFDQNNERGKGPSIGFTSLVGGRKFIAAGEQGAAAPVAYHRSSPASVEFARKVHNDALVTEEVYQALEEAFPDLFEGVETTQIPELRREGTEAETAETKEKTLPNYSKVPQRVLMLAREGSTHTSQLTPKELQQMQEAGFTPDPETSEYNNHALEDEAQRRIKEGLWDNEISLYVEESVTPLTENILKTIHETAESFGLVLEGVQLLPEDSKLHGYMDWGKGILSLSKNTIQKLDTPWGQMVLLHELGHLLDWTQGDGQLKSVSDNRFSSRNKGDLYQDILNLVKQDPKMKEYFGYALNFKDDHTKSSELFAQVFPMVIQNPEKTKELLPNVFQYVQEQFLEGDAAFDAKPVSTGAGKSSELYSETYSQDGSEETVTSLDDFLERADQDGSFSLVYAALLKRLRKPVFSRMNNRLKKVKFSKKDPRSVLEVLRDPETDILAIRDFKNTALVDPETGTYDKDLLELSLLAVADWMVEATPPRLDGDKLQETLERLGMKPEDVTKENRDQILNGLPPQQVAEQISRNILKFWGVQKNKDARLEDLHGVVEGLTKELLTVMQAAGYFQIVELNTKDADGNPTTTQTLDISGLKKFQDQIKASQKEDTKTTAKELLFSERRDQPSVGEKIEGVSATQNRSDVALSKVEQAALKNMQDIPHFMVESRVALVDALGGETMENLLGYTEYDEDTTVPALALSLEGKNTSIQRDLKDVQELLGRIPDAETPVYYPYGITRVGRHQAKGVNPQNNKILRALVSPNRASLDLNSEKGRKALWLGVAQATGLFKTEKVPHSEIMKTVEAKFQEEFGTAKDMLKTWLKTGEIDGDAFFQETGQLEMQELVGILTVAEAEFHMENSPEEVFQTSLSYELDGLTNGAANMMVNFGQGILTGKDFNNLQRVGLFLGNRFKSVNEVFSQAEKFNDLYETTSDAGQQMLTRAGNDFYTVAAAQFAARFGNFKIDPETGQSEMTRNTAKNPMTKVNYGSGVTGVGVGIADDMVTEFYRKMSEVPDDTDAETYFGYPGLRQDIETLFGVKLNAKTDLTDIIFSPQALENFRDGVVNSLGQILTESTKGVIGDRIIELNDMLVFTSNVQAEYLSLVFQDRLEALAEERAKEGKARRNKQGKAMVQSLSQRDYDSVVQELSALAPVFVSDDQTLSIAGFERQQSPYSLSANMDGKLRQKNNLLAPANAGVKAIPFLVIGSGDAMMMNLFFANNPQVKDVLGIFDGLDVPLDKIEEYAQLINESVLQSWDRDVVGSVVNNFQSFLNHTGKDPLMQVAFANVAQRSEKSSSVRAKNPQALLGQLKERHRQVQARKAVMQRIPLTVDQMGGSNAGYSRNEGQMTFEEINQEIRKELAKTKKQKPDVPPAESYDTLHESTAEAEITALLKETMGQDIRQSLLAIRKKLPEGLRVVFGSEDQINQHRQDNFPSDGEILEGRGNYDSENQVIYITRKGPETIAHELIHAATFEQVLAHYEGQPNEAVQRLEGLMEEFLGLSLEEAGQGVNEARSSILKRLAGNDAFSKAAALNEYMAWALSNEDVIRSLKTTRTKSFAGLVKRIKALLRKLMGGVPQDMFSHTVFNTKLLDRNAEKVVAPEVLKTSDDGGNDSTPPNDGGDGGDSGGNGDGGSGNSGGDITPPAWNKTNYWLDQLRERLDDKAHPEHINHRRTILYSQDANKALEELNHSGMVLNQEQKAIFRAIYVIMAAEMKLDSRSVLALNKLFNHVVENLTPDMFGKGREAQEKFSAVMDLFGSTKNEEGISDALAVLLALSQTSKQFRKALDQLPEPASDRANDGSLNDHLSVVTQVLMQKLTGSLENQPGSASEVMDNLAASILVHDREEEFAALRLVTSSFDAADRITSGAMRKVAGAAARKNQEIQEGNRTRLVKALSRTAALTTSVLDKERTDITLDGAKEVTHMGVNLDWAVPVREFVSEVVGTDRTNKNVVALLDETNQAVSSVRQAYREDLPVILQNQFETHPDEDQWNALHFTLGQADFSALFDLKKADASFRLVSDSGVRSQQILQLEKAIEKNYPTKQADVIIEKAQQLAGYMNGKGAGHQLLRNAYAIAKLSGGKFRQDMVPEIDRLVSLYALDGMDSSKRDVVAQLYQEQPEAVKSLAVYLQGLNQEEDNKVISEQARLNGYKGYIPDHGEPNVQIRVAPDAEAPALGKLGFRKVKPFEGETGSILAHSYYVTTAKQGGNYSQGVMQSVQPSYRGVDSSTGLSRTGNTGGLILGEAADDLTEDLNAAGTVQNVKESLIPVFDDDGVVYAYEMAINPDLQQTLLGRKSNLALMLGAWAGRQVEEKFAVKYNEQLVDELKDIWDNRDSGTSGLFIDLSSKDLKDPVYKDAWDMIPKVTKEYIKAAFPEGGFMVRKDMLNLSVGYREASVVDAWTGKSRMPKPVQKTIQAVGNLLLGQRGMNALEKAGQLETITQSVVSTAKDIIVVRSLIVPFMNAQVNVYQLLNKGVTHKRLYQGYREKLLEVEQYNENVKKLIELEVQVRLNAGNPNKVRVLESQMQSIRDLNARMSIAPMIEAGAYKNLSEGITDLDVSLTSGKFGQWVDKAASRLPSKAKTIAEYGMVSKSTKLYQGANRAVQYGDFLAKSILYDHLIAQGLKPEEALSKTNEEFVNFSPLPGRTRSYLESLGATWFMTFKIRIAKIALQLAQENPVRSMVTVPLVGDLGSPITDNIVAVAAEDRLDYALGWDMLAGAPDLNPWVQLMDWSGK